MERAMRAALEAYSDAELRLILDFLTRARDASVAAMAEISGRRGVE
jgi:hypothetical protein